MTQAARVIDVMRSMSQSETKARGVRITTAQMLSDTSIKLDDDGRIIDGRNLYIAKSAESATGKRVIVIVGNAQQTYFVMDELKE